MERLIIWENSETGEEKIIAITDEENPPMIYDPVTGRVSHVSPLPPLSYSLPRDYFNLLVDHLRLSLSPVFYYEEPVLEKQEKEEETMDLKFEGSTTTEYFRVEQKDEDLDTYLRRNEGGDWEERYGESWEPCFFSEEYEEKYQTWKKLQNEVCGISMEISLVEEVLVTPVVRMKGWELYRINYQNETGKRVANGEIWLPKHVDPRSFEDLMKKMMKEERDHA